MNKKIWFNEVIKWYYYFLRIELAVMLVMMLVTLLSPVAPPLSMRFLNYGGVMPGLNVAAGLEPIWWQTKLSVLAFYLIGYFPAFYVRLRGVELAREISEDYIANKVAFSARIVVRLKRLSKFVLLVGLVPDNLLMLINALLYRTSFFIPRIDFTYIFVASVIYLMAEIILHGLTIQKEQDLTI